MQSCSIESTLLRICGKEGFTIFSQTPWLASSAKVQSFWAQVKDWKYILFKHIMYLYIQDSLHPTQAKSAVTWADHYFTQCSSLSQIQTRHHACLLQPASPYIHRQFDMLDTKGCTCAHDACSTSPFNFACPCCLQKMNSASLERLP